MRKFDFNNYDVIYDVKQVIITWSPNVDKKGGMVITGATLDEALSKFKLASNIFTIVSNIMEIDKNCQVV